MGTISEKDKQLIRTLREEGRVLVDVDGHRVNLDAHGTILVGCADCDQRADLFRFQEQMHTGCGLDPRIHSLLLNGGALLISEQSPLNEAAREDLVLVHHIANAHRLKGINVVTLYAHLPCGAAGLAKLTATQVIDLLVLAKLRLKREFPWARVACYLQVDKGEGNRRTYFVPKAAWVQWRHERGEPVPEIDRTPAHDMTMGFAPAFLPASP